MTRATKGIHFSFAVHAQLVTHQVSDQVTTGESPWLREEMQLLLPSAERITSPDARVRQNARRINSILRVRRDGQDEQDNRS